MKRPKLETQMEASSEVNLCSLEEVHLTGSLRKKLNAFHLRGLRKILRMPKTFVNRQNI